MLFLKKYLIQLVVCLCLNAIYMYMTIILELNLLLKQLIKPNFMVSLLEKRGHTFIKTTLVK